MAAWTQKTKPSLSGSQKRAKSKVSASPNEQGQKKAPKRKAAKPKAAKPKAAKPAKKNIFKDFFTPTSESIAKNKIAGAKHTASQKAKGIGVARSNITDSSGKRIKGVANSETNPALVRLAKQGKRGAEGLNELARQQSATTGKDTSFKGVFNSLMSGEKHTPRQSLLQFGSKPKGRDVIGEQNKANTQGRSIHKSGGGAYSKHGNGQFKTTDFKKVYSDHATGSNVEPMPKAKVSIAIPAKGGGGGGSSQDTALAGGSAGRTGDVNNQKNMLAMNRKKRAKGKKSTRNLAGLSYSSKNTGLNIPT